MTGVLEALIETGASAGVSGDDLYDMTGTVHDRRDGSRTQQQEHTTLSPPRH